MRVLIVHHGRLPAPGQPVTGGALRAWNHGRALQAAGFEVAYLTRHQDAPGGFRSPPDLVRKAGALRPDRVLAVQIEDVPALAALRLPLAVDLYAPRLIEGAYSGTLAREATQTLHALSLGDVFLVSNVRQRWHWLGLLALAGIDTRQDPTLTLPLVSPVAPPPRPPMEPRVVTGGARWPWQDPTPGLRAALRALDRLGRGELWWYGGPPLLGEGDSSAPERLEHPRLRQPGWLGWDQLLAEYSESTLAFDWMTPNPERSMALSFRQVDWLACGLPILTGPDSALGDLLGEAGWTVSEEAVEETLCDALSDPAGLASRATAALQLARGPLSPAVALAPLVAWMAKPTRHPRGSSLLVDAARESREAASAGARAEAAGEASARAEAEVELKRQEVTRLNGQVQDLIEVNTRLSRAIDEVAGFKREAIAVLGGQSERAHRTLREAEREVGLLRADLEKKSAELLSMDELRARLEHDVENLRKEVVKLRQRGLFGRA